jgi:hypothetical protein
LRIKRKLLTSPYLTDLTFDCIIQDTPLASIASRTLRTVASKSSKPFQVRSRNKQGKVRLVKVRYGKVKLGLVRLC